MKNKALYPGSFDPLTVGHLNIIERAARIFDEVVVGIGYNPSKQGMFTIEERIDMAEKTVAHLDNVKIGSFTGLLADYVNKEGFNVIVKGLRNATDFDYEMQMVNINARLFDHPVETVSLMTEPEYSFISSSMVKEVHSLGGNIEGLVPDEIFKRMVK
ncbi:MAG: pantetheine-phosphate adenylyltransferase [Firmicutes bacterium]|nr:pantetheine-phosphate adenylyltransferase [Bacillota bacterium]